ncbi:MAG: ThiF family adenylyltransferase, partial [Candidatus Nealsonbacteria bacterium]|nr:ThiF family adenylyltransferase [Candidatus Nealsonbacteria bacterium]
LVVVDEVENQLRELFLLRNPHYRFKKESPSDFQSFREKLSAGKKIWKIGRWVYYPWLNYLVHFLDENFYQEQRTSRNVYLITKAEQRKFYRAKIGVLGSSIGSHAALTVALTGGAKCLKLADPDEISISNLNRIRLPFYAVGLNKAVAVARQIYEINPYAKITVMREGLTEKNLKSFLLRPRLNLIIEEMDNLYLKIRVREFARRARIPVITGTDNGDNIIIDIERYDLHPDYPIFHGRLGRLKADDLKNISPAELPKITARIAGAEIATLRMIESVAEVGKTIYSWPQLGNAATLCGGVLTYVARKIILGERIKEGRIEFNVDGLLGALAPDDSIQREKLLKKLFVS